MRRRRECPACGRRFTTFERLEAGPAQVVKRDGAIERFHPDKLRRALAGAAHKRPVTALQIDAIVDRIEARAGADGELEARAIGDLALTELHRLDYGAYLQFAGTLPDVNPEFAMSAPTGSVRLEEHLSSFPPGPPRGETR